MRRKLSWSIVLVLIIFGILLLPGGIYANTEKIHIVVNGQEITPDVPPQMIDGRVMVPARFIVEPLGGIATGSGSNKFNPKENISRQDMMALTARVLEIFKELKAAGDTTVLDKFSDKGDIAVYAVESLATLMKECLFSGSGDKLNPRAQTTRAEAAVFLYRIYNKY